MHRNYKSSFHTNNSITYNIIPNKIIKEHTIIDGIKFSKKIVNKINYKSHEKKFKSNDCDNYNYNDDYDSYDEDYDSDY